jgi:peptidoglycan glycosyltransferase
MARVAATIANGGTMPFGRWVTDKTNARVQEPKPLLAANLAEILARDMRSVVTAGTGKRAAGAALPIAGKTGTAEIANGRSHAWFIGFAPYGAVPASGRRLAFAVVMENGQYGGTAAAPVGAEIVNTAQRLGLFQRGEAQ